jgi:hypothetical protein
MTPADFSAELDRLAQINSLSRRELDDTVFSLRATTFRTLHQVISDAGVLDALRIGIAADFAKLEELEAADLRTLASAGIDGARVSLSRCWHRFAFIQRRDAPALPVCSQCHRQTTDYGSGLDPCDCGSGMCDDCCCGWDCLCLDCGSHDHTQLDRDCPDFGSQVRCRAYDAYLASLKTRPNRRSPP